MHCVMKKARTCPGFFFVYKMELKMVAAFLRDYESEPNS